MPVLHNGYSVGEYERFLLVMRDEHHRDVKFALQPLQFAAHTRTQRRIKVAQRFIQQAKLGLNYKRTRKCNALLLTAAYFVYMCIRAVCKADKFKVFHALLPCLRAVIAAKFQPICNVFKHSHVREKAI